MLGLSDKLSSSPFASRFGKCVHNVLEEYAKVLGKLDWEKELFKQIHFHDDEENLRPYDDMETASKRVKANFFVDRDCYACPFFQKKKQHCKIMAQHIDEFEGCPKLLHLDAVNMLDMAIRRYDKYFKTGIKSKDNPDGKVIGVEEEFTHIIGKDNWGEDIIMHGYIDLIIEEDDDTIIVVDYKTGFKTKTTEELMKDIQPRMYSLAAKLKFPEYKFVLLTFDYFRGVPIDVGFSQEQDEVTREVVCRKWNEIKAKHKIKRRPFDWYCQYLCNRNVCNVEWAKLLQKRG
jgi:ATP-dependent exoDNAse (exonuclease V) beta subunit